MINVNKTMLEIEKNTKEKNDDSQNEEVYKNMEKLLKKEEAGSEMYDLLHLSSIKKRLTIPRYNRRGPIAKIINFFLLKHYHLMSKMLDPVLDTQEKFNRRFILELLKSRKK